MKIVTFVSYRSQWLRFIAPPWTYSSLTSYWHA